jgi:hypothetical protein
MLDTNSLEIISQFKQAVLSKNLPVEGSSISIGNRGSKLDPESIVGNLSTKVVEYDGTNHVVLTNKSIERSNYKNKRSFYDSFDDAVNDDDDDNEFDEFDDDSDNDLDDHPFKKLKICDILAPLTHPSEIITHTAISRTFKLTIFSKLSSELINLIQVEQNSLNHLNKLFHVLNGEDWFYLLEQNLGLPKYDHGLDIKLEDSQQQNSKPTLPEVKQEDRGADPFFGLPEALKIYDTFQNQQETQDDLTNLKEELTTYLQASIQRQHEYIKNLINIRNGIVRADRLKRDLYKWGKEMHDKKSN